MSQHFTIMSSWLYDLIGFVSLLIGVMGVSIILIGSLRGLSLFFLKISDRSILLADIRVELGHYLALGLEFLVAKDIVETIVSPTWEELGKLTVLIVLRTLLTLFLAHEVKEVREELEQENMIRKIKKGFEQGEKAAE
jgi:uncharacterized membrane protein